MTVTGASSGSRSSSSASRPRWLNSRARRAHHPAPTADRLNADRDSAGFATPSAEIACPGEQGKRTRGRRASVMRILVIGGTASSDRRSSRSSRSSVTRSSRSPATATSPAIIASSPLRPRPSAPSNPTSSSTSSSAPARRRARGSPCSAAARRASSRSRAATSTARRACCTASTTDRSNRCR